MPSAKRKAGHPSNGNMLNDGSNTLTYDAENRLLTSSGSLGSGSYSYDGNNLRVKKVSGSTTTVYIFSGSKVIAEYDNGAAPGSPSREYIYSGTALLAKIDSSGSKYYHQDHLSNRAVTGSSGNTAAQLGHFPYGESWYNASSDKLLFTTYERDAESGNDYAMARYDVNRLGRFSSPDPLPGSIDDPQSLNRYSYVRNMPVILDDLTGMWIPCVARNVPEDGEGRGVLTLASYLVSEAEPEPEPQGQVCLDGFDITDYGGDGMGFRIGGDRFSIISVALTPTNNDGWLNGEPPTYGDLDLLDLLALLGPGGDGPDVAGLFEGLAKALAKMKLNKKKCLKDLAALGVSTDQVREGASNANFLNGAGSTVPASTLYASAADPIVRRNAPTVRGTVGDLIAQPGTVAVSQLGGHNIYLNPSLINPTNYWQNMGTIFHEVLHNITGLTDPDVQRNLGLAETAIGNNITQKLIKDCF